MRAEIEIKEVRSTVKEGWFKSRESVEYRVIPNVKFTDEEKAILTKYKYWERVAFTTQTGDPQYPEFPYTVLDLAQPDFGIYRKDPMEAQAMARRFEEEILPTIKGYIVGSAAPMEKRIVDL